MWSLAQRKKGRRGSNHPLVEPDPTGLPAGSALIILEQGPNAGSRFLLDQPASVGRHPRSDIFLDDVTVSRRHVELRWEKDDFHDHVARPQRRQLCKRRDRRQQSPQEEAVAIPAPILAPLRRWMRVRGRVSMIRSKRRLTTRAELPAGRSPGGDDQRRDRRRGRASRRAAAARPVPRRSAAATEQHGQRGASRQDQHLRRLVSVCLRRVPTLAYDGPTPPANGQPVTVTVADGSCAQVPLSGNFHSVGNPLLRCGAVASERPGVLLVKRASIEVTAGVELQAAVPRGCK